MKRKFEPIQLSTKSLSGRTNSTQNQTTKQQPTQKKEFDRKLNSVSTELRSQSFNLQQHNNSLQPEQSYRQSLLTSRRVNKQEKSVPSLDEPQRPVSISEIGNNQAQNTFSITHANQMRLQIQEQVPLSMLSTERIQESIRTRRSRCKLQVKQKFRTAKGSPSERLLNYQDQDESANNTSRTWRQFQDQIVQPDPTPSLQKETSVPVIKNSLALSQAPERSNENTISHWIQSKPKRVESQLNSGQERTFTTDHITPELAAWVVKNYVLPMFDSDLKKDLRRKSPALRSAKTVRNPNLDKLQNGNIHEDLKLTSNLLDELNEVKSKFQQMEEDLEEAREQRSTLTKEIDILKKKNKKLKQNISIKETQLMTMSKVNASQDKISQQQESWIADLTQITITSEAMRRRIEIECRSQSSQVQQLKDEIIDHRNGRQIYLIQKDFYFKNMQMLSDACNRIETGFKTQSKKDLFINDLQKNIENMTGVIDEQRRIIANITNERDCFRDECRELNNEKKSIMQNFITQRQQLRDKLATLAKNFSAQQEACEQLQAQLIETVHKLRAMTDERDLLKKTAGKMLQRMGKNPNETRLCKNCSKEYREKENFNWSCRIHPSEWGGEMWWCCGKHQHDAPGCKYRKHEWKNDTEDLMDLQLENLAERITRKTRCGCCNEYGHSIDDCVRDPNFKTNQDANEEFTRIQSIKDFRKMNSESNLSTLHFIKKACMLPNEDVMTGKPRDDTFDSQPFLRGIMNFDDYNYNQYNPHVLIEDPTEKRERIRCGDDDLSEQNLLSLNRVKYKHDALTLEKSEFQLFKEREQDLEDKLQQNIESEKQESKQSVDQKKGLMTALGNAIAKKVKKAYTDDENGNDKGSLSTDSKHENLQSDPDDLLTPMNDDDEDLAKASDFKSKVFFNVEEINKVIEQQRHDTFNEIHDFMYNKTHLQKLETKKLTRIDVSSFAPKPKQQETTKKEDPKKLKGKKRIRLKEIEVDNNDFQQQQDLDGWDDEENDPFKKMLKDINEAEWIKKEAERIHNDQIKYESMNLTYQIETAIQQKINASPKFSRSSSSKRTQPNRSRASVVNRSLSLVNTAKTQKQPQQKEKEDSNPFKKINTIGAQSHPAAQASNLQMVSNQEKITPTKNLSDSLISSENEEKEDKSLLQQLEKDMDEEDL